MSKKLNLHESMEERTQIQLGSERSLAIVFAIVFLVVAIWPVLRGGAPRYWAIGIGSTVLMLGFVAPRSLRPLNQLWFQFGMLLHRVVNPLVMALLFFGAVAPTGLVMRLFIRDPLRLKFDPQAATYWVKRRDYNEDIPHDALNDFTPAE